MKIAILGGRFDPIHTGHILIARQVLEFDPSIEKVVFVPANEHHWKSIAASPKDRTGMINLVLESKMEVSDIEIKRKGISYSIDTVKYFNKEKNTQIYWIIGSDIVSEFDRWKDSKDLLEQATFLVFPRDPYSLPQKLPKGFKIVDLPNLQVSNFSSTLIRKRIKDKKTIKDMVPEIVESYIMENNLYV